MLLRVGGAVRGAMPSLRALALPALGAGLCTISVLGEAGRIPRRVLVYGFSDMFAYKAQIGLVGLTSAVLLGLYLGHRAALPQRRRLLGAPPELQATIQQQRQSIKLARALLGALVASHGVASFATEIAIQHYKAAIRGMSAAHRAEVMSWSSGLPEATVRKQFIQDHAPKMLGSTHFAERMTLLIDAMKWVPHLAAILLTLQRLRSVCSRGSWRPRPTTTPTTPAVAARTGPASSVRVLDAAAVAEQTRRISSTGRNTAVPDARKPSASRPADQGDLPMGGRLSAGDGSTAHEKVTQLHCVLAGLATYAKKQGRAGRPCSPPNRQAEADFCDQLSALDRLTAADFRVFTVAMPEHLQELRLSRERLWAAWQALTQRQQEMKPNGRLEFLLTRPLGDFLKQICTHPLPPTVA